MIVPFVRIFYVFVSNVYSSWFVMHLRDSKLQDFKNDAECHFQLASQKMPYCPKYLEPPIQDVYCDTDIEMCIIKFQK